MMKDDFLQCFKMFETIYQAYLADSSNPDASPLYLMDCLLNLSTRLGDTSSFFKYALAQYDILSKMNDVPQEYFIECQNSIVVGQLRCRQLDGIDDMLNKIESFEKIKISIEKIDKKNNKKKKKKIFEYSIKPNGLIVITSIKEPDTNLGNYLKECLPFYLCIDGWMADISKITDACTLPEKCLNYIHLLEIYSGIPISVISVGPTRENKVVIKPV